MGLDYSYLLYFKRENLWDALQGVVRMAEPHQPPTRILFPDRELLIPLDSWAMRHKEIHHDDPEFSFTTVLRFDRDEALQDYIDRHGIDDPDRGPPDPDGGGQFSIGYIYLDIHQEIPERPASDLVLFDFGTPGTRMSLLFDESSSIRQAFVQLLERYQGVCGVFNREDYGRLIWLNGQIFSEEIDDPYLLPDEIESFLQNHR